jgi:hypothetical protein
MVQQFAYYFGLYILVLGLSFWNQINEYFFKQDPDTPEGHKKFHWLRIFFVGNEIIFSASGVYILFISVHPEWEAPLIVGLLLIIIFSSNTTSLSRFIKERHQLKIHVGVMTFIFVLTYLTLIDPKLYNKDPKQDGSKIKKDSICYFNVAIPYTDQTIVRDYGNDKAGDKLFVYYIEDTAKSEKEAINKAIVIFSHDTAVQPLKNKNHVDKMILLKIQKNKILTTRTNL